ncbi:response regulator [Paenibacillus xylanexedens]|uniref:response regulator n=1 Tax=Paenibacillus xylanexedens TaxID=528191 RepID=UPI00119E65FE|nr:response regulator [Paenibacillus xylanexedens]
MFRILITDDEPMIRMGLAKMIEQAGLLDCEIRQAAHGEEALQVVEAFQPHILFTDIRMPTMDGIELCRRLSEQGSAIRIIVVSGYSDFEYARACMDYGVKRYLLKPVGRQELHELLLKLRASDDDKPTVSLVPVRELNDWAMRLEDAIWELRQSDVAELMEAWLRRYPAFSLMPEQTAELFQELLELIVVRMNARGNGMVNLSHDTVVSASPEGCFDALVSAVDLLMNRIKERRSGKRKHPVEEAKAYLEEHLRREVSLDEIAAKLGLNPSYFSQLFKQTTGQTFIQYRIRSKMELAKRMLEQPGNRITDISYEVGYADHPHFTKTFKKITGLTPSEYRNRLGIE